MFENIPWLGDLIVKLEELINLDGYLEKVFDFILDLSFAEKAIGLVVGGIIVLLGAIELIKKLSKLIIIVAILLGLWVLYNQGFLDGLIG